MVRSDHKDEIDTNMFLMKLIRTFKKKHLNDVLKVVFSFLNLIFLITLIVPLYMFNLMQVSMLAW